MGKPEKHTGKNKETCHKESGQKIDWETIGRAMQELQVKNNAGWQNMFPDTLQQAKTCNGGGSGHWHNDPNV